MRKMRFILLAGILFWGCQKDDNNNNNNDNNTNPGSVTDASGNTYPTVNIGNQIWMAENLRTTKYRDGSNIPVVTDNTQWANNWNNGNRLQKPMMCWYNNDQATYTTNKFGALYNWYAVNPETNGNINVCPVGWHVPSIADWQKLANNLDLLGLGGTSSFSVSGHRSMGNRRWLTYCPFATNASCFSALPGGRRDYNGVFCEKGNSVDWWTSDGFLNRKEGEFIDCNVDDSTCLLCAIACLVWSQEAIDRYNDSLGNIESSTAGFASLDACFNYIIGIDSGVQGKYIRCVKDK